MSSLNIELRRPHRADARRNFDAVLAAAREAFAEQGSEASLEDIARRAGVGIGTLYRNFPTRQELLNAVGSAAFDKRLEVPAGCFEGGIGGGAHGARD